jgi:SNF family Na+-dependent transporter
MGIPLLLMELSLGQKFQRGDISVFRGIHPRLAGVGLASVFSAYIITWYYNVIISWSLVYFVAAFKSPLPWSKDNTDWVDRCDPTTTTRAEEFFNIDVIRFYDDNCKPYEDGDASQFSVYAFIAVLVVWLFCFLAIFKGVKSSSYIVWVTVPLPILFIIVMIINNTQLEGAGNGIKQYLQGNGTLFELIDNKTLNAADLDTTNSTYLAFTDNTTVEAVSMYSSLTQLTQNAADILSFE